MKNIGLTGGIGSGKSTVSRILVNRGIPVYNSDYKAKLLMDSSIELKEMIIHHFGKNSYLNNRLNKNYISNKKLILSPKKYESPFSNLIPILMN